MAGVRKISPHEADAVATTLASAFAEDPLMAWLMPDRGLPDRLRRFFLINIKSNFRTGKDDMYVTDDGRGVALWSPPGKWRLPPTEIMRSTPDMVRIFGRRLVRALRTLTAVEGKHPHDEHWYLAVLGTHADFRGKGKGGEVLAPILRRCDEEGIPAYLESSNPRNIPFYVRQGFEPLEAIHVTPDAPVITPMRREPRPPEI